MNGLFLIMARGGSKRIPKKNIKILGGRPLIHYTLDCASAITSSEKIYISTDSDEIIEVVEKYGISVPFKRPKELALDNTNSEDTMLHAIEHYEKLNVSLDYVVLLQPTSPFRKADHVKEALNIYMKNTDVDMVVSVTKSKKNPYKNLFEQNEKGYLHKSKTNNNETIPDVYQYNGAIYVINVNSLKKYKCHLHFEKIVKYEMGELHSIDIDEKIDWILAEQILKNNLTY